MSANGYGDTLGPSQTSTNTEHDKSLNNNNHVVEHLYNVANV